MINRIKTDNELVQEAARKLAFATTDEFDQACADMVEVLQYANSAEWWKQFERVEEPPPVVDDGSCDPLHGQRMDSVDMGEV